MERPTIRDLAQAAGVSVATVNRVLAGKTAVRPKTMQLAQADMLAMAAMCVTASDRAVAAWREVA